MSNEQLSRKRVAASQAIHAALLGAVFLAVKYGTTGAFAYAVFSDGVKEYMYVDYNQPHHEPDNQHEWAMMCIEQMYGKEEHHD